MIGGLTIYAVDSRNLCEYKVAAVKYIQLLLNDMKGSHLVNVAKSNLPSIVALIKKTLNLLVM